MLAYIIANPTATLPDPMQAYSTTLLYCATSPVPRLSYLNPLSGLGYCSVVAVLYYGTMSMHLQGLG